MDTTIKNRIDYFLNIGTNKKNSLVSLLIVFFVGFVSYSAFIVYGFASPDGILEGAHYYINQGWAIAGCGRWFLVVIDYLHANLVFPWLTIIECTFVNWLSAHTICKILKIENKWSYFIICALFSALPPFIEMYTYTNSALSYSISILFSILFVYINSYNKKNLIVLSGIFLGCAMGSYQSQLGVAVGLTLMLIVIKIIENEQNILSFFIISTISGIFGLVVYIAGLKVFLKLFNLVLFSRAASFSLLDVFTHFFTRFIEMYKLFFSVFNQITLKRNYVFLIICVVLILEIIVILCDLIKKKKFINAIIIMTIFLLLPVALNIIGIILPSFNVSSMMQLPNYIIIPFTICLSNYIFDKAKCLSRIVLGICIIFITWTYVLSANATYECYRLSYNMYKTQFSNAMDEVYKLEGYEKNSTRIVVIGRPNDTILRENIQTYNYAINLYNNLLYWESTELDPATTHTYIISEFGVDPGIIEYDEYVAFFNLKECLDMPSWPSEGSVRMIDGNAVIKFSEVYE